MIPTGDCAVSPRPRDAHRKGAACLSCRRQKIRCTMPDAGPPCTRCEKRTLVCEVERLPQLITNIDNAWKRKMERQIHDLQLQIRTLSEQCSRPDAQTHEPKSAAKAVPNMQKSHPGVDTDHQSSSTASPKHSIETADQHWRLIMGPEAGLGDIPGSCVSQVSSVPASGHSTSRSDDALPEDIVMAGILSLQRLQTFFDIYLHRFDHFLYRILGDRHDLQSMRASSPLLTAAICAVCTLHTKPNDFTACYNHFVSLAAKSTFSRENSIDDVLALILGAYWLNDISWALASAAVRMAIDCQLHKSIWKALEGDRSHYLNTRLYYLVFVCDHHYSIVYGRPPLTKRCEAIRAAPAFCKSAHATPDDLRIAFQIDFWSTMEDIWDAFGVDVDKQLSNAELQRISRLSIRLDTIRAEWADRFESSSCVGNYASKGSALYHHFARLYLFTHALRGISKSVGQVPGMDMQSSIQVEHAANAAIFAATATIRTVITDPEVQSWLNGFHSYYHIMVAFAAVFLLKVCKYFGTSLYYDSEQIRQLLESLVELLTGSISELHPGHWLIGITKGVRTLLNHVFPDATEPGQSSEASNQEYENRDVVQNMGYDEFTMDNFLAGFDMRDFDFLGADSMDDFFSAS